MSESILKVAELQVEQLRASLYEAFSKASLEHRLEMFKRWLAMEVDKGRTIDTPERDDPKKGFVAEFAQFMGLEEPRWEAKGGYIAEGNIIYLFSLK